MVQRQYKTYLLGAQSSTVQTWVPKWKTFQGHASLENPGGSVIQGIKVKVIRSQ